MASRHGRGGLPGSEVDGTIYADYLLEVTTRGEAVWESRSWEHLDFETEIISLRHDQSLFDFFSPYISGAQRLPNGNTLICEGCDGRIFEVTPEGVVVWEYVNPYFFVEAGRPGLNNWVFRYAPKEIERARRA